ncbi:MAG: OmpA/MotB domain protein [Bryobacterales bacterium]|nr:OmpA/MotB domain protein [Bryobacterales bacterium]
MPEDIIKFDPPPTVVFRIKKKKVYVARHGGAWKVAYADFVTALMALFIVMWLLNASQEVRKAIGGYFQDPTGVGRHVGSAMAGTGEALSLGKDDMPKLKERLSTAIKAAPEFNELKNQVEMIVTGEGLRIELLETDKGVFFESGRPQPTEMGRGLVEMLAGELGKLPNRLLVEGHTDARPFSVGQEYGNWELSADRANAARRLMEENGVRPGQVEEVRGFADRNPRRPKEPDDPSNRRVSVIVRYQVAADSENKAHAANAVQKPTTVE